MRTVLTTVGTSLLTNFRRDRAISGDQTPTLDDLREYLAQTPAERASAETNSLMRLLQEDDYLVFLRSETPEGQLCTEALQRHYQQLGYQCRVEEIPDLRYDAHQFKVRGLRALAATMARVVRQQKQQHRQVIINATGGFKAEIAYAVLIGQLFEVPVYYIHEAFKDIIEIPPLPVGWDYSLLVNYEDFFDWIEADLRSESEAHSWLQGLPEAIKMLLSEEEGYVMLSPAGEAYLEAYRFELSLPGQSVFLSRRARDYYDSLTPDQQQAFRKLIERLARVRLHNNNIAQMRDSDLLIFPQGRRDERIVFYMQDEQIYICELARHSDKSYDCLYERGVHRSDYDEFELWSPEP